MPRGSVHIAATSWERLGARLGVVRVILRADRTNLRRHFAVYGSLALPVSLLELLEFLNSYFSDA